MCAHQEQHDNPTRKGVTVVVQNVDLGDHETCRDKGICKILFAVLSVTKNIGYYRRSTRNHFAHILRSIPWLKLIVPSCDKAVMLLLTYQLYCCESSVGSMIYLLIDALYSVWYYDRQWFRGRWLLLKSDVGKSLLLICDSSPWWPVTLLHQHIKYRYVTSVLPLLSHKPLRVWCMLSSKINYIFPSEIACDTLAKTSPISCSK